jgi:hypothetical protein
MALLFASALSKMVQMGSGSGALNAVSGSTLTVWVNPTTLAAGNNNSVFGLSTGSAMGASRSKVGVNGGGNVRGNGRCLDTDGNQDFIGTAGKVTLGSWQHIAATFDYVNKLIRLYYNGVLDFTSGIVAWGSVPTSPTNSLAHNIGSQHGGGSEFFNGAVEDARVYGRLLTLDEIVTIYSCRGTDGIVSGLRGRYLLSEAAPGSAAGGAGQQKDCASDQRNGTPVNAPVYSEGSLRFRRKVS